MFAVFRRLRDQVQFVAFFFVCFWVLVCDFVSCVEGRDVWDLFNFLLYTIERDEDWINLVVVNPGIMKLDCSINM